MRELVVPLQDFDKRWRSQLPPLVEEPDEDDEDDHAGLPAGTSEDEARRVRSDYDRWTVEEKVRLEAKREEAERKRKGKERAVDQDASTADHDDEDSGPAKPVEVRPNDWLADKELLECVVVLWSVQR